jgi:pimeloyl-ACP methyl ester carboxylesterase
MLGKIIKVAVVLGILIILGVVAVGGWYVWKRPLTVAAWAARSKLGKAGLSESTVIAPSGPMTVWKGGSGAPMVLLHGAGDQAGAWADVVPALRDSHRLLVPDLPGHWHSPPADGPLGIDVILAGLAALVDAELSGDEQVTLVGNSMGAWLGMLYGHQHPDRVALVVAINGGALLQADPQVNLFPKTREEAGETMAGLTAAGAPAIPGFVLDDVVRHARVGSAARLAETAAEMGPYLLDGRLHELSVPVALIWGDADQLLTVDYAQRMLEQLPLAQLTLLEDCGHVSMRECPDKLNQALIEVLAAPPAPAPEPEAEPAPAAGAGDQ